MKIQVMSKKHGHQELVCLQKRDVKRTLDSIEELDKGYMIHARMNNGQTLLLQEREVPRRFDEIDTILIRPALVSG